MREVRQSYYRPRERSGPGYICPESEIKIFWEKNKNKFWNPERGLYEDAMLLESMAAVEPEIKLSHEQEKFVKECEEIVAAIETDMQTIQEEVVEQVLNPQTELLLPEAVAV